MLTAIEKIFEGFVSAIPTVHIPSIAFPPEIYNIINTAWYFLPMNVIGGLLGVGAFKTLARIAIAIFIRVKSLVPFSGGA